MWNSKMDKGRPFLPILGFVFLYCCLPFLSRAQKTRVFIDWKVGECVACQGPVAEYLRHIPKQDTLYVLFPENYRAEEATIREALPVLESPQIKVLWDDVLRKSLGSEMVSYLYHVDSKGKVVAKAPLKGLPAQAFQPLSLPLKKPLPAAEKASVYSGNTSVAALPENGKPTIGDTLRFEGSFPLKPTQFQLSESYIGVTDQLTGGLYYYDRKVQHDTVKWNLLRAKMLRPATYRRHFGLPDTTDTQALEDSLAKKTAVTGFGTNGSVTGMNVQGNSIYFSVKYSYLSGIGLFNTSAMYELRNGKYYGPWFENSPSKRSNDSLFQAIFDDKPFASLSSKEDSNQLEIKLTQKFHKEYSDLVANSRTNFSIANDGFAYLGKNLFAMQIAPSDSQNYWFLAYYQRDDTSLKPVSLTPFRKPELWRENNLGPNMVSLSGKYPYLMLSVTNTLYDLKNNKTYTLPISLGDYDYSPEVMRVYKPRISLFVQDVIGDDRHIKVLYSLKEKTDKANRMYLLDYDLASGKVLSQKEYLPGGTFFEQETMYRFDGMDRIAALRPDCRCIVFYPAQ